MPVAETVYSGDIPIAVLKLTGAASSSTLQVNRYDIYADQVNAPRLITRATDQAIVWRCHTGEAFGAFTANENPSKLGTFKFNQRFPGQVYDAETGNFYNYFRDYDPQVGRFVQSDPIGLGGGVNTYAYVRNNPLRYIDRLGLVNFLIGGGGSYVAGGGAEASGGIVINPGLGDDSADVGVFGTYGLGGGLNVSADGFIGFVTGSMSNVQGPTNNSNLSLGPISVTIFYAPDGSGAIGGTIGLGPSLLPFGASATKSNTGVASVRDWLAGSPSSVSNAQDNEHTAEILVVRNGAVRRWLNVLGSCRRMVLGLAHRIVCDRNRCLGGIDEPAMRTMCSSSAIPRDASRWDSLSRLVADVAEGM